MRVGNLQHSYQHFKKRKSGQLRGQCWFASRAGYKQNCLGLGFFFSINLGEKNVPSPSKGS